MSHEEKIKAQKEGKKFAQNITNPAKKNDNVEELQKLKDQVLRMAAENENLRKRQAKELEDAHKYGTSKFARDLIEVLENLHRAESSIKSEDVELNDSLKQIHAGIELTKKSLTDAFDKWGIARVDPQGEAFNHDFHQAITQVPTAEHPVGTVVQVIQAGYVMKDRLLRPALVAVAKAPEAAPQENKPE